MSSNKLCERKHEREAYQTNRMSWLHLLCVRLHALANPYSHSFALSFSIFLLNCSFLYLYQSLF